MTTFPIGGCGSVWDIAFDGGYFYVTDPLNHKIYKLDENGTILISYGTKGKGVGQFWGPKGIAGWAGNIYVADEWNKRVVWLEDRGDHFEWKDVRYLTEWEWPRLNDVEVDNDGFVYVIDNYNSHILKFAPDLSDLLLVFGSRGYGENQFYRPSFMHIRGNDVVITEEWGDSSGIQYYGIKHGIADAKVMFPIFDATEQSINFYFKLDGKARISVSIRHSLDNGVVSLITDSLMNYGAHYVDWDGRDASGKLVLPGKYFCDIYATSGSDVHDVHLVFHVKGTIKSGNLAYDEHWTEEGEPYVLTGDVWLRGGSKLIIDPGVKVMPTGNYGIYPKYQNPYWQYIYAQGSAIFPIRFTPYRKLYPVADSIPNGFWKGIHINESARAESLIFDHCIIEGAGSDSAALWVHNANKILSVTNTEISKSGSYGLYCNYRCNDVLVTNCLFKDNDSIPLHANFKWIDRIYDNRFENNGLNVIEIESATLNTDATIHNQGVPYWFLKGEFLVQSSDNNYCPTLTVEPGVKIFFHDSSGLYLGVYPPPMRAKILAQGALDSMIIFSALDTTKHWRGIHIGDDNIADTSRFEYCKISYGGRILNTWFDRAGGNIGFLYDHTPYTLKNCEIKRSLSSGCGKFYVTSGRDSLISFIQNNLFEGNDSVPLYLGANELGACYGNSFVNNGIDGIFVKTEQIDHSLTIANQGIPYVFYQYGPVRIDGRAGIAQVLISPDNTLKFADGFWLVVGDSGVIKAKSVTFTAFDTIWRGIKFDYAESDTSVLDSCIIEKTIDYSVGDRPYGAVHINGSRVKITNSAIINNRKGIWLEGQNKLILRDNLIALNRCGIYRTSSDFNPDSISIKKNSFLGNKIAVVNYRTSRLLYADSNWWGDASGPWDPSEGAPDYNPTGRGDSIGDYVLYRPWLGAPVQPVVVILIQPNGGEILYSGCEYEIKWRLGDKGTERQSSGLIYRTNNNHTNEMLKQVQHATIQNDQQWSSAIYRREMSDESDRNKSNDDRIGKGILRQELYYTTDFPEGGVRGEAAFWKFIDTVPVAETSYVWRVPNTPSKRCRIAIKIYYTDGKFQVSNQKNHSISNPMGQGIGFDEYEKRGANTIAVDISDANFTIPVTTDYAYSTAINTGHKILTTSSGSKIYYVYANEGWTVPPGIHYCYSSDSGRTFIFGSIDSSGYTPALALNPSGSPCASWVSGSNIMYTYWYASWAPPDTIGPPVVNVSPPSMAVDTKDTVHLVYVQYPWLPPTTGDLIHCRFPRTNLGAAVCETLLTRNRCHTPSLVLDESDDVHIVWQGENCICYLEESLNTYLGIDTIYTTTTNEELNPVIDLFGTMITVVWQDKDSLGNLDIYSRIKTDVGWDAIKKVANTSGESRFPSLAGAHYCLWQDNSAGNFDVYLSEYVDTLGTWTEPVNISNSLTASAFPHCAYALVSPTSAKLYCLWTEGDTIPYTIEFKKHDVFPVAKIFVDLGQPVQSPYCLERDGYWRFGSEPYKTTDWGYENLQYKFTGLDPEKDYRLDFAYYFENHPGSCLNGERTDGMVRQSQHDIGLNGEGRGIGRIMQVLVVDGVGLDTGFITPNKLVRKSVWLNKESYADGEIIVDIIKIKGKRVVCSEMGLYEFLSQNGCEGDIFSGPMGKEREIIRPFYMERCYPNPTTGVIRLRFNSPDSRKVTIKLYDVCGRLVQEKDIKKSKIGLNEVLIRPEGLSAGVYFVRVETEGYEKTEKAVLLK